MANKYYAVVGTYCPGLYKSNEIFKEFTNRKAGSQGKSFKTAAEAIFFIKKEQGIPQKCYLAKTGRRPGIYLDKVKFQMYAPKLNIAQCTYNSLEEALAIWEGEVNISQIRNAAPKELPSQTALASTDGSYNLEEKKIKYGGVLYYKGRIHTFSGVCSNTVLASHGAELAGCIAAINLALKLKANALIIEYDREGVHEWALNPPPLNAPKERGQYYAFIQKAKEKIEIYFSKVKAHSDDQRNIIADSLARTAITDITLKNPFSEEEKLITTYPNRSKEYLINKKEKTFSLGNIVDVTTKTTKTIRLK